MTTPKKITCADQVFGLDFHPTRDYLAAGLVDGTVELWRYSAEGNRMDARLTHHSGSCRDLQFSPSGDKLISVSSDKSWKVCNESGVVILQTPDAHNGAINRMLVLDQDTLATGDDNGIVKVWDMRGKNLMTGSWDVHTDFISHMIFHADSNQLFTSSGDATLGVYDIRLHKNFYKSDDQESEMNCLALMRNGRKLIGGTQDGVTLFFNWGDWGDCSDRFPVQMDSIECFHKIDETTVLTGCSDGLIRVVNVQPNKVLGVLGDQKDCPVEMIKADKDDSFIGTLSLDDTIRFWDLSMLKDESGDEEEAEEAEAVGSEEGGDSDDNEDEEAVDEDHDPDAELDSEGDISGSGSDSDSDSDSESDKEKDANGGNENASDGDSGSDSDDSDKHVGKKPKRLPTAREQFYADL